MLRERYNSRPISRRVRSVARKRGTRRSASVSSWDGCGRRLATRSCRATSFVPVGLLPGVTMPGEQRTRLVEMCSGFGAATEGDQRRREQDPRLDHQPPEGLGQARQDRVCAVDCRLSPLEVAVPAQEMSNHAVIPTVVRWDSPCSCRLAAAMTGGPE